MLIFKLFFFQYCYYKNKAIVSYSYRTIFYGHINSWFYFDLVKNVSKDKTFHSCQIPLSLVEMLIKSCTNKGDDCFILFGGSGSELALCQKLKRNFISCEIHPEYYEMIQKRLKQNGKIDDKYRLPFIQKKKSNKYVVSQFQFPIDKSQDKILYAKNTNNIV